MMKVEELRQQHPRFFFEHAIVRQEDSSLALELGYRLENGPSLTTLITFPNISAEVLAQKDLGLIQNWAAQIGMVEGLSYWKTCCSPEWVIQVPGIIEEQIPFWQSLLKKGMSEFFFLHGIDAWQDNFVRFTVESGQTAEEIQAKVDTTTHQEKLLIPVGGGKDSVVSSEILRDIKLPVETFSVNMYPQLERVVEVFWDGTPDGRKHIQVTRRLDPHLLEMNTEGYLNGHTPFSAMVAFISTLAAYLYDFRYVPLSNEWSANEGNTVFLGQTINHQYSKTIEFEQLFREYQQKWLSQTIEYFSFLRPLHELQIAELFIQYPQYWPVFLSCNRGQKRGHWCGECPKCLFVAIMLAAFLPYEKILGIFGTDILNNKELTPIFDQLVGFTEVKSLECVGTRDETRAAIALAAEKQTTLPYLLTYGWQTLQASGQSAEVLRVQANDLRKHFVETHFLPVTFSELLKSKIPTK
jgi:UDP-N-acetyl-alpha-D-muramoyl-L-alanyl-L-glutamate epimerase